MAQHDPAISLESAWGLYGERQVAASDWFHGSLFGIAPDAYSAAEQGLDPLFWPGLSWDQTKAVCRNYGISVLVVQDADPIWGDNGSWIWRRVPGFAGERVRVFLVPAADLE